MAICVILSVTPIQKATSAYRQSRDIDDKKKKKNGIHGDAGASPRDNTLFVSSVLRPGKAEFYFVERNRHLSSIYYIFSSIYVLCIHTILTDRETHQKQKTITSIILIGKAFIKWGNRPLHVVEISIQQNVKFV